MNEKLEKLNQEIEKTEKKLRRAQHEEKILEHQIKLMLFCPSFDEKSILKYRHSSGNFSNSTDITTALCSPARPAKALLLTPPDSSIIILSVLKIILLS